MRRRPRRGRARSTTGKPARRAAAARRRRARIVSSRQHGARGRVAPPYPRLTMPGCQPRARKRVASAATSGVLPLPPTVMLPTTTTGTGSQRGKNTGAVQRPPQRDRCRGTPRQRKSAAASGVRPRRYQARRRAPRQASRRRPIRADESRPTPSRRDCVANVMWMSLASRAASITWITDWCVALASALMMITGSLASPAARFSASASAPTVVN